MKLIRAGKQETKFGVFDLAVFGSNEKADNLAIVYYLNDRKSQESLLRIQYGCLFGNVFSSLDCDCQPQVSESLRLIQQKCNGLLVYLPAYEGKGVGLINKAKLSHYTHLTDTPPLEGSSKCGINFEVHNSLDFLPNILTSLEFYQPFENLSISKAKIAELLRVGVNISKNTSLKIDENNLSYKAKAEILEKNLILNIR